MARRRPPDGNNPGRKRRSRPAPENLPDLPDPRTRERHLHQLTGGRPDPGTPRGQAQELVAQAFAVGDPHRRVELSRQGLAL